MAAPVFADATGTPIVGALGYDLADVVVPEATGPPEPTYAAVGTLPTGVTFATDTRTLSFDEDTIEVGSGTITIRATNMDGTADWTVDYQFVTIGLHVTVSADTTIVQPGGTVTLTGEAYGDLIVIAQGGADPEGLWALTQMGATWLIIRVGSLTAANLRSPRSLTTRGGNLYAIDWWGEDIYRITDIAAGSAVEIGTETSSSLASPEGAAFLGDVFWSVDQADDALWRWTDVDNSPNGGTQQGTISIAGSARGLTVRNNLLAVIVENGTTWTVAQVDDPTIGSVTQLASMERPAGTTGTPVAMQEYRGSLWIFTDDQELVELTGIGGTPAFIERADFDANMESGGPGGMTQFPMPSTYAWTSDNGGSFADASALNTTWEPTGVAIGTDVTLTLTVTEQDGSSTVSRTVMVRVASAPLEAAASLTGGLTGSIEAAAQLQGGNPLEAAATLTGGLSGQILADAALVFEVPRTYYDHGTVGTLIRHHPSDMFTDDGIWWLDTFEVIPTAAGDTEITLNNGASTVDSTTFVATWTDAWGLYVVDITDREYVLIRANSNESADADDIVWSSASWELIDSNIADPAQWLLERSGSRLVVGVVQTSSYRPYIRA